MYRKSYVPKAIALAFSAIWLGNGLLSRWSFSYERTALMYAISALAMALYLFFMPRRLKATPHQRAVEEAVDEAAKMWGRNRTVVSAIFNQGDNRRGHMVEISLERKGCLPHRLYVYEIHPQFERFREVRQGDVVTLAPDCMDDYPEERYHQQESPCTYVRLAGHKRTTDLMKEALPGSNDNARRREAASSE